MTNRAVARDRVLHRLAAPDALSQHPLSDTARSGRPLAVATPDLQSVVVQGASFMGKAAAASGAAAAPTTPSLVGLITSVVFSMFSGLERLVTGPPRVPPNSTVTVHSSTLQITDDLGVPADWYYPAGDDPPGRLILLQHGFVTIGPMYSYTAANLAEDTHSIVVAPTLTSNPFADGGLWLWGDGMSRAVAGLFTEDRAALTQSALAAGYAQQYGLDPDTATLPRQFALVGHSAGGAAVSGTAGYLAENGAAADLAGVILLDGVPFGDVLPGALTRLDTYEQATDIYIPVRQIAAPWSIWNFLSNANESLSQARPGGSTASSLPAVSTRIRSKPPTSGPSSCCTSSRASRSPRTRWPCGSCLPHGSTTGSRDGPISATICCPGQWSRSTPPQVRRRAR